MKKQKPPATLQLTDDQLNVIRKLIARRKDALPAVPYSKRTIEAVLHGRRTNPLILMAAIQEAKKELEAYNKTMQEIETLFSSDLIALDYNPGYDPDYLKSLREKAKIKWEKGEAPDQWLRNLRGSYDD